MPHEIMKKTLESITDDEVKEFDKLYHYQKEETKKKFFEEHWYGHDEKLAKVKPEEYNGGLKKLFEDFYVNNMKNVFQSNIHEDQSTKNVADLLDKIVIDSLNASMLHGAKNAAETYKKAVEAGEYKDDNDRISQAVLLARRYLGLNSDEGAQTLNNLVETLKKGDKNLIRDSLIKFKDMVPDGIYNKYVSAYQQKILSSDEKNKKMTAYSLNKLEKDHGIKPKYLGKKLLEGPEPAIQTMAAVLNQSEVEKKFQKIQDYEYSEGYKQQKPDS